MRATTTEEHGQAMGIGIAQELVEKVWDAVAGIAVGALLGAIATAFAVLGKHGMSVA
jgi:orotate phosphoribosyltransferase